MGAVSFRGRHANSIFMVIMNFKDRSQSINEANALDITLINFNTDN